MQTITVDGTRYTLKFDRDPIAWAKLARKPYKPAKPKDIRKFPRDTGRPMSTGDYVRQFETLNMLTKTKYNNLNYSGTALYDPSIPLVEILEETEQ